jgi:hypothetical protein
MISAAPQEGASLCLAAMSAGREETQLGEAFSSSLMCWTFHFLKLMHLSQIIFWEFITKVVKRRFGIRPDREETKEKAKTNTGVLRCAQNDNSNIVLFSIQTDC